MKYHSLFDVLLSAKWNTSYCTGEVKNCVKFFSGDALGTEDIEWPPRSPDIMHLDVFLLGSSEAPYPRTYH
jgi:hypothetical protein